MILLGFARGPYWPYLMFGVIGVASVFDDVGVYSSLQQVIPPRLMGRALGVRRGLLLLSMGLGSAVTPLLIDAWEPAVRSSRPACYSWCWPPRSCPG
jgi:MFS family permease